MPILLGRAFFSTSRALVEIERDELKLRLNNEEVVFNIHRTIK